MSLLHTEEIPSPLVIGIRLENGWELSGCLIRPGNFTEPSLRSTEIASCQADPSGDTRKPKSSSPIRPASARLEPATCRSIDAASPAAFLLILSVCPLPA